MEFRLLIQKLDTPADVAKLVSAISDLVSALEVIYTETAPDGNLSGRIGQIAIYNDSGTKTCWQNTDGSTAWQQIDGESFKSGDLIFSSVTTARSGWTDVTATYNDKFIRISTGTALDAGGADTHTHGVGSYAGPSHTHGVGSYAADSHTLTESEMPAHTHTMPITGSGDLGTQTIEGLVDSGTTLTSSSTGGGGGHTHTVSGTSASDGTGAITGTSASADNVPAYIQLKVFKKD